jgi:hypothetical protein
MNNYDYNFNGGIIEKTNDLSSKFGVKMNNLKWFVYFLICFNLFQMTFFMGFSFFSIIIVIYIFYISYYVIYTLMNDEELNFEFDHITLSKQLKSLGRNILTILILSLLDLAVGFIFMKNYLLSLFDSYDNYEYYFGIFTIYLSLLRIAYMSYLYYYVIDLSKRD